MSVDPAPPSDDAELSVAELSLKVKKLEGKLLNKETSIFERYRALFALRNVGNDEAVEVRITLFHEQTFLCFFRNMF